MYSLPTSFNSCAVQLKHVKYFDMMAHHTKTLPKSKTLPLFSERYLPPPQVHLNSTPQLSKMFTRVPNLRRVAEQGLNPIASKIIINPRV